MYTSIFNIAVRILPKKMQGLEWLQKGRVLYKAKQNEGILQEKTSEREQM